MQTLLDFGVSDFTVVAKQFIRQISSGFPRTAWSNFGTGPGWEIYFNNDPTNLIPVVVLKDSDGSTAYSPTGSLPKGSRFTHGMMREASTKVISLLVNADKYDRTPYSTSGNVSDTDPIRIGQSSYKGQIDVFIGLRRLLTDTERTELAAWDGTVANEPAWLREDAIFYINADDPIQTGWYLNNRIINLASIPRREYTLDLSSMENINDSVIRWTATTPAGTTVKVYVSSDGTTWTEQTNGAEIAGISARWGQGGT